MIDKKTFTGPRPTTEALRRMWETIQIQPCPYDPAPFAPYLEGLRSVFMNGGALLYCFTISEDPAFDWFPIGRDTLYLDNRIDASDELDFFTRFLGSVAVRGEAKELEIPDPLHLPHQENELIFGGIPPLMFEGGLAHELYQGGAYGGTFPAGAIEAKRLAQDFRIALFGDRYEEVLIHGTGEPWCPWFCDMGFDSTDILFDKRTRRLWLFCCTDTH